MDVGIVIGFQNPPAWRRDWPGLYRESLDFACYAESSGIDEVWLTEHHFTDDGYCPALLPVAAAIAARTSRVRIGTKLILLPFHDPVRLAEDAAVVDILSAGRLDLGVGAGYRPAEFAGFGIRRHERGARFEEGLAVLRRALAGEEFEHHGRFFDYGTLRVSPPPVQHPVPLWVGGRSERAMLRAARLGCHLQLADFDLAHAETDYATFAVAVANAGRPVRDVRVAAVATVFVDEDPERAWRVAGPHLLYQQDQYARWFAEAADRPSDVPRELRTPDDLRTGAHLVGTPGAVARRIAEVHARVPFTHFSFWTLLPGLPAVEATRSLDLFVREVLPHVRRLGSSPPPHEVTA